MDTSWYDLERILPGVWRVDDGGLDTSYFLVGDERAAVIDTGMGIGNLASLLRRVTDLPAVVVNTHAHPDHWQGNWQFNETIMSAKEWAWVHSWQGRDPHISTVLDDMPAKRPYPPAFDRAAWPHEQPEPTRLLHDGDVIELGGASLEVVTIPAHTPGGLALLDRERRLLFAGDTVQRRMIWLQLAESADPVTLDTTYAKLGALVDKVDWVLPGHTHMMLPGAFLGELAEGMGRVCKGLVPCRREETFAGDGWYYDLGGYGPLLKERLCTGG